jgi:uncharacterized protein YkwD
VAGTRRHAVRATVLMARVALLPLLAAVVAGLALAVPAGAEGADCAGADVVPAADNLAVVGVATLCLINNERGAQGVRPLTEVPGLSAPARAYSVRMVTENFFSHVSPDGGSLVDRLSAARYIDPKGDWSVGENIAWGQAVLSSARSIVVAWMNSDGHRHNILAPEYTQIGIGIVPGTPGDASWGATYTTDFGDPQPAPARGHARKAKAAPRRGKRKRFGTCGRAGPRCRSSR